MDQRIETIDGVKRVFAHFVPQAWISDYATPIDGAYDFDITDQVIEMGQDKALSLTDNSAESDFLWENYSEGFKPDNPEFHNWPFYVECQEAIHQYFGVPLEDAA